MKSATLHRAGLAAVATTVALGTCFGTAGSASADAGFGFSRVQGADRYATSVEAAKKFGAADTVILANGENGHYPDALTASYLAGLKHAPVLPTTASAMPAEVKTYIESTAKNVIIVGGTDVVSQGIEDTLEADLTGDDNVKRLAGLDRYRTAAAVINEGDEAPSKTGIVATGENFPDALGGGPLSYVQHMPLAITQKDSVPASVLDALVDAGVENVIVLGGTDVVSDAVVDQLAAKGITLKKRIAGVDRSETSAKLAEEELATYGFSAASVSVASGAAAGSGADALGASSVSGKSSVPLLITNGANAPGAGVIGYLSSHAATLTDGTIFGGTSAVTVITEQAMEDAAGAAKATNLTTKTAYATVQAAIDAATAGDVIQVTGTLPGFTVDKKVTVVGLPGAHITSAVQIKAADGVQVSGLKITPSVVSGQLAGIYLDNVDGAVISENDIEGVGHTGAGVLNAIAGDEEKATINNNTFHTLAQGVYANPSAAFTITGNVFDDNNVGSANDAASTITGGNLFRNNDEGVGLGIAGTTVSGNNFVNSALDHVGDYTAAPGYDLAAMITGNHFDEPVHVVTKAPTDPPTSPNQWIADVS